MHWAEVGRQTTEGIKTRRRWGDPPASPEGEADGGQARRRGDERSEVGGQQAADSSQQVN